MFNRKNKNIVLPQIKDLEDNITVELEVKEKEANDTHGHVRIVHEILYHSSNRIL